GHTTDNLGSHYLPFHAECRLIRVFGEDVIDILFVAWKCVVADRTDHAVRHDLHWSDWYI
ncbi:MAG: hypothetical protein ACREBU_18470, partial [Nitrososphaera sp.]